MTTFFILAAVLALFLFPVPARADSFNVPCTGDPEADGYVLLQAFEDANDTAGDDTITLAAGCVYEVGHTIDPYNSQPTHLKFENGVGTITLLGNGATIEQVSTYGVAEVWANASAIIDGVTLRGGAKSGIQLGGGLFVDDFATLVMTNSTITGNSASRGGGLFSRGISATLTNVTISSNSAPIGANIYLASERPGDYTAALTLQSVNISGGTATGQGGGVYVESGSATIANSTISGNNAGGGSGLANYGSTTVDSSTFSGNSAPTGNGAGIYNSNQLTVRNSTVSGNTASAGNGGGLYSDASSTFYNSTFSGNSAAAGGGFYRNSGAFTMLNSIVANSTGGDCAGVSPTVGYTLIEDASCGISAGGGNLNGDPSLGPLQNNGGSTLTHALLPGSIALDAGSDALIPGGITTDQTGAARIQGASVDMGSVEGEGSAVAITVTGITRNGSSPTNAASVSWTVTFSGSAIGVAAANFSLVPTGVTGASISNVSGGGTTWTVTASTGTGDGTLGLDLTSATGITPAVSNAPFTGEVYTIDKTAPTATITSAAADPTNTTPIPVTVTFSEDVTGFVLGDVTVGNGTAGNFAGGPGIYTFDVTPTGEGAVTVDVAAGVANDNAGNANTAATQFSIVYDSVAPTVTITSSETSPTNANPIPVTVTFSEDVTGFTLGELVVGNGTAAAVSSTGSVYTFNITPTGQGAVTVDVAAGVAEDAAGNLNTAATQFSIVFDSVAPTVTISSVVTSPTNTSPIPVTVTFSESVADFVAGDLTLGNGTVSNFTGSGTLYSFDLTPSGQGAVTVDVAAGVATDAAGNGNTPATQFSIVYDSVAPTVTITSSATASTNLNPILVTVTFSEDVTGFTLGELVVGNGTAAAVSSTGSVYTFNITPAGEGAVTVNVAAGVAADAAGNPNTAAAPFSVTYDVTAPTTTISSSASNPTNASPIPMTVTFSEAVTGFDASDVLVTNGTAGIVTGSGALYSFSVTPAGPGLVTVDVGAGAAADAAGNASTAAAQFSITFDSTAPTTTISSAVTSPTNDSPIPVTVTFSESVTGFVVGDVTVGNGAASNLAGGPSVYTVDITPAGDGLVTVDVAAGVATDTAGNGNSAAAQFSITYDVTPPSPTISSTETSPTNSNPIPVTVTFSEIVTGFAAGDVTVGNGTLSNFAGSGTLYSFDVTPAGQGAVTVDVPAGGAVDAAGNGNTAAAQFSITFDSVAPTTTLSSTATSPTSASPIPVTVTFSEDMTGFVVGDVTVGNGTASNLAGGPSVYTVDITPAGDGLVTVDVAGGVAADAAGNGNTAAAQFSITFDGTAPTTSITSSATSPTNTSPIPVTVTFSESVTGFVVGDVTVGNGTAGNLAGGPSVYTLDITPTTDGAVTVDVAGGVATDSAGNGNTVAAQFSITFDAGAPTPVISSTATDPTSTSPIPVTVTFDEDVTGFDLADVTVGNGTAGNLAGGPAIYTFDVTPTAAGAVTVDVAAGAANDTAGNASAAAAQFSIAYQMPGLVVDPAGLTVAEGGATSYQLSLGSTPTAAPVSVTLTFDSTELTVNGSASPVVIDLSDTTPVTVNIVSLANALINNNRVVNIAHEVTASTAAEYPLGMSATLAVTITDGVVVVEPVATLPPPPPIPVCEDHNFAEGGVVRSSTSDALGYGVNCRVLYQNGSPTQWLGYDMYNAGAIGNQAVLDLGVVQAIDIFSPAGMTYFQGGAVFCLRGSGTLIWLAASQAPRVPQIIGSYSVPDFPGFTCATLFEPGTLVLVRDNPLD